MFSEPTLRVKASVAARLRRALVLVTLLLSAAAAPSLSAAPAEDAAEVMFQRGLADMLAGRYASGCPAIAQSLRLDARPGTLFTLAECESRAGLTSSALDHYQEFLRLVAQMPAEAARRQRERERIATEQSARLTSLVPTLVITLPRGAPPGTVVKRDGALLPASELGVAVRVDPGAHNVTVAAPDGRNVERPLALEAGERRELAVALPELAPPLLIASSPPPATRRRWAPGLVLAGATLAAAGGGALWIAKGKVDSIDRARAAGRQFDETTGNFTTYEVVSATLLTAGAAALLSGVWLYLAGRKPVATAAH